MKYYELTNNTKIHFEKTLTQIKRLSDGKLGGWIEKESNLVQDGSWVDETSIVYGVSVVSGKSQILNNSRVRNNSFVYDSLVKNSSVKNNSNVYNSIVENSIVENSLVSSSRVENSSATTNILTANLGKHAITVCDDKTSIGCEVHTHDYWLNHIEEIGVKHGYTKKEIELYKAVLTLLIERKKEQLLISENKRNSKHEKD